MRKDTGGRKTVNGALYTVYEVKGLNLDRLINVCKKRGIDLYDIKKYSNKRLRLAVNFNDSKNFFAITCELCYNIKKIRERGRAYPFLYLLRNVGIFIGAVVFILVSVLSDDLVLDTVYSGSGAVYSYQVESFLLSKGVKRFSRFSDIDLGSLGEEILTISPLISFAECRKDGNRLKIQLVLGKDSENILSGNVFELKTDVDGVVESLKVYRGTAIVKVGDKVNNGDLLVGGYAVINDITIEESVVAYAVVVYERVYEYRSENDGEELIAVSYAEQACPDCEYKDTRVEKTKIGDTFAYTVTLLGRRVLFAG